MLSVTNSPHISFFSLWGSHNNTFIDNDLDIAFDNRGVYYPLLRLVLSNFVFSVSLMTSSPTYLAPVLSHQA